MDPAAAGRTSEAARHSPDAAGSIVRMPRIFFGNSGGREVLRSAQDDRDRVGRTLLSVAFDLAVVGGSVAPYNPNQGCPSFRRSSKAGHPSRRGQVRSDKQSRNREGHDFQSCRISPPNRLAFAAEPRLIKPTPQSCHPERSEGPRIRCWFRCSVKAFSRYSRHHRENASHLLRQFWRPRGPSLRSG
jgi:hypothetical protein